jgi:hypothetical protein
MVFVPKLISASSKIPTALVIDDNVSTPFFVNNQKAETLT